MALARAAGCAIFWATDEEEAGADDCGDAEVRGGFGPGTPLDGGADADFGAAAGAARLADGFSAAAAAAAEASVLAARRVPVPSTLPKREGSIG